MKKICIIQQNFKMTIKIIKNLLSNSERAASHKFVADAIVILLPKSIWKCILKITQEKKMEIILLKLQIIGQKIKHFFFKAWRKVFDFYLKKQNKKR